MGSSQINNDSRETTPIMSVSIVLPIYNEEECIEGVVEEIVGAAGKLPYDVEILMIDDGSSDSTPEILTKLAKAHDGARFLPLPKNMGQSAAMLAGMRQSKADVIVTMDADGQNDPADIASLLEAIDGYDCVCGFRPNRQDSEAKRLGSKLANAVRSRFLNDGITDTGCSLKAVRREFTTELPTWNGIHRFFPVFFQLQGATVNQVPTNHRTRSAGESKYTNFGRLKKTIWDLFAVRWMASRWIDLREVPRG